LEKEIALSIEKKKQRMESPEKSINSTNSPFLELLPSRSRENEEKEERISDNEYTLYTNEEQFHLSQNIISFEKGDNLEQTLTKNKVRFSFDSNRKQK